MAARAAIGFAIHTGWVASVVLTARPLRLLDRRRIGLAGDDVRFCYHLVAEHGAPRRLIDDVARASTRAAVEALKELRAAHPIVVAALPRPKRALPPLDDILRAHPLVHTAEGELYRVAVADACAALGLEVVMPDPALPDIPDPGRPWAKDQRDAAALAFSALLK